MLRAFVLVVAATGVSADYLLSRVFPSSATCGGSAIQTVANYIGCWSPPGQTDPISLTWTCVNSSSAIVSYYKGGTCAGPVNHAVPMPIDTHCAAGPDSGSTQVSCEFGDYTPSPAAINVNIFANAKNSCPVYPSQRVHAIMAIAYQRCIVDGDHSYWYGCSQTEVTGVAFESDDCSGTPHPAALFPLGCFANASNPSGSPQFTVCPRGDTEPVAAAAHSGRMRGAAVARALSAPSLRAVPAALDAAIAAETARALELVAAQA